MHPIDMEDWLLPAAITTFTDGDPAENGWVSGAPPVEAIEIAAYSPEWPVLFEASKELIAQALPGVALQRRRCHVCDLDQCREASSLL